MSKDIITLLHGIVSKKVLTPGWGDGDTEGLILTVVSTDRRGQAAAYCQLIHQHQPWILAAPASSLILDNSTKQSDSGLLDAGSISCTSPIPIIRQLQDIICFKNLNMFLNFVCF